MPEAGAVLVTGAGGAIGGATVRRLDQLGWRVFAGVRSEDVGERLRSASRAIEPVVFDLCDEDSITSALRVVESRLDGEGLDALINVAAISVNGPIELIPASALRRQFEVNVIGPMSLTRECLPLLRKSGGRVINISGAVGRFTLPVVGPLSASKSALNALTHVLRMELKNQGVKVVLIEPGKLKTELFDKGAEASRNGYAGTPETERLYQTAIQTLPRALDRGLPGRVEKVIPVIVKAMTADSPRALYVVGADATVVARGLRYLPRAARDRLLIRAFGLRASDAQDAGSMSSQPGLGERP